MSWDDGIDIELLESLARVLGRPSKHIDVGVSFIQNGGDSLKAILFQQAIKTHGYDISRQAILTSSTIRSFLGLRKHGNHSIPVSVVVEPISSPASSTSSRPDELDYSRSTSPTSQCSDHLTSVKPWNLVSKVNSLQTIPFRQQDVKDTPQVHDLDPTELLTEMQLSLIHETVTTCGANMITYIEYHCGENTELFLSAWKEIMSQEPILQGDWFNSLLSMSNQTTTELSNVSARPAIRPQPNLWSGLELEASKCEDIAWEGRDVTKISLKAHHAYIDAYSLQILVSKVRARVNGDHVDAGPSFWTWANHLRTFQRNHKVDGDAFWARVLEECGQSQGELLVPLPQDTSAKVSEVVNMQFSVPKDLLQATATKAGVTPASIFYAAWAITLAIFADSDSIVFGSVFSGRGLDFPGSLDTVGPLINVLPLHVSLDRALTIEEYLRSLFTQLVELEAYSWTTTENGFKRDYESALSVEMEAPDEDVHGLQPITTDIHQRSQVPISIKVRGLSDIELDFHGTRFSQRDARSITDCYQRTLEMLPRLDATIGDCMQGLLSCPSHAQLMRWGNCITGLTTRPSVTEDLVSLFEAAVKANPDAVAVEKGDSLLSYRELDKAAQRIAHSLSSVTTEGDVVCVDSDRSVSWICAIWGVLKAGCTYCSLDPQLPITLREKMFKTISATAFLASTNQKLQEWTPSAVSAAFSVEAITHAETDVSKTQDKKRQPQPNRAAYVCFTSGSTGVPKPVVCTHAGLVAFQRDLTVRLNAKPGVRVSQIMSVAFDGSIHEIFSALTYGATLVLPANPDVLSALSMVHSAILTPSIANALDPSDFPKLQTLYLVGEPVPQSVADKWAASKTVYNMYGPTEATCGATIKQLYPGKRVTIGKPNPTTRVYILNSKDQLMQPGMIGRIHLAGVQVSLGYHGMPEQTARLFRPDGIVGNGERMYDTGDLGYWTEDGEIVCIGRKDRQVKLRGYRLDLTDLEIRIARADHRLTAVAIAVRRGHDDQGDGLVAMVQPRCLDVVQLRARLKDILPLYAQPRQIVLVDKIPMTPAGKVDYKAVASATEDVDCGIMGFLRPALLATEMEKVVAAAFEAVLPMKPVDALTRDKTFDQLGGHSMEQIKLARHLTKSLNTPVTLPMVIRNSSIEALARAIDEAIARPGAHLGRAVDSTPLGLSNVTPIEADWLDKYSIDKGTSCFNLSSLHRITQEGQQGVDMRRLEESFNTVLRRHDTLRSIYRAAGPSRRAGYRRILTAHHPRVQRLDTINEWAELNRPFRLSEEHAIRVFLSKDTLLLVMHHIIADYTTLSVLLREVSSLYQGEKLSPIQASYPPESLFGEAVTSEQTRYWREALDKLPSPTGILTSSIQRRSYRGRSTICHFDAHLSRAILACPSEQHVSLQHLGMAAVALGLMDDNQGCVQSNRSADVVMGVPYMNRGDSAQMEMVGLFLQPLPVRIRHDWTSSENVTTLLETVKSATQSALANGLPWHQLLELANGTTDHPDHPLFDIMVTFHEPHMVSQLDTGVPWLKPCFSWSSGAKFRLMCEFTAVTDDSVILRVEYDDESVSSLALESFLEQVTVGLESLTTTTKMWNFSGNGVPRVNSKRMRRVEESFLRGKPISELEHWTASE
ncbi:AMP-binding enzyme domain-containing protein [Sarocladium implicatum]|nr:AMP-binding enzyme domain-containing protein [Sarocladium implicatum]